MNYVANKTPKQAAITVGISLLLLIIIAVVGLLPLLELIEFGEEQTTKDNIEGNKSDFNIGIGSYLIILVLDIIVAVALYIVLRPADQKLGYLTMVFRLLYVAFNFVAVIALALLYTTAYDYVTLFAYFFFICHLFVLGNAVNRTDYIPKWIGIILIIASFGYLILQYGEFILSGSIYDILYALALIPAYIGELTLGVYLLVQNSKMPEKNI